MAKKTTKLDLKSLNNIQKQSFEFDEITHKLIISKMFSEIDEFRNFDGYSLFLAHFNTIPNCLIEEKIYCRNAIKWFTDEYKNEIKDSYYNNTVLLQGSVYPKNLFLFLFEDLIIDFDEYRLKVKYFFRKTDTSKIEKIIDEIKKFKLKKNDKPKISLLVNTIDGIDTKLMEISKPKLKIIDNYNDDFLEIHKTILNRLSTQNDKGLVLLHGKPGTGKTSYIRYLISFLKKEVIFLPPNLACAITNPDLIKILINSPNTIFVIEDAENIVVDREMEGNSPVSALLNISDGLLSDCLSIQIICSFNTDISKIDNALMRKGRLIAKYEFKELEVSKAQLLANKLGYNTIINSPMTLTDIYNLKDSDFQQTKKGNPIGFKTINAN